jgi:chromosome segregation ATPase
MKISYERKMGDLLKDIRQIEDERDKILGELTVLDRKAQEMENMQTREDREKSRAESERFKERLRVLEEELKRMRKKMKDHQKLVSFKEHGEVKIQQLSTEVSRRKVPSKRRLPA